MRDCGCEMCLCVSLWVNWGDIQKGIKSRVRPTKKAQSTSDYLWLLNQSHLISSLFPRKPHSDTDSRITLNPITNPLRIWIAAADFYEWILISLWKLCKRMCDMVDFYEWMVFDYKRSIGLAWIGFDWVFFLFIQSLNGACGVVCRMHN